MAFLRALGLGISLLVVGILPLTAEEVVGTTSAKFGVTPHGAASYSSPIAVPPGTMELQPELVLQYNSHDDNGLMGVGWTITGLSYITRCATDLYHDDPANDGVGIDPVDYDDNDKFCLNGQRLVPVSGAYGADGTEYRTMFEEFSKIVSYGSIEGGPSHFRVWKRSGEILDYGTTEDSKIRGQARDAVRSWALARLADAKGNYIAYSYHNDRTEGEFRISRVDYTGNDGQALAPYNHIAFVYEDRPDTVLSYHAGDTIRTTKRLKTIQVLAEGQLAREYRLAYKPEQSPISGGVAPKIASRLSSVADCATATVCFKPSIFEWIENPTSQNPPFPNTYPIFSKTILESYSNQADGNTPSFLPSYNGFHVGDFNGDGKTDYTTGYSYFTPKFYASLGDGNFSSGLPWGGPDRLDDYVINSIGDFNGDGISDVYTVKSDDELKAKRDGSPDYIFYGQYNSEGSLNQFAVADGLPKNYKVLTSGDFDGDGLTDLYMARVAAINPPLNLTPLPAGQSENQPDQVWLANNDGTFRKIIGSIAENIPDETGLVQTGDFNGDGLADLLVHPTYCTFLCSGSYPVQVWISNGDGTFDKKAPVETDAYNDIPSSIGPRPITIGHFNSDNIADFFVKTDIDEATTFLSNGDGSFDKNTFSLAFGTLSVAYGSVRASGDFNGDGFTDLLLAQGGARTLCNKDSENFCERTATTYLLTSNGNGTFSINSSTGILGAHQVVDVIGDFDGDGTTDYLADSYQTSDDPIHWGYPSKHVGLSRLEGPDRIIKITNGHDLITDISYKSLTDSSVYTKATDATYPVQDRISARQVVSSVRVSNGIGGQNEQTYQYSGLRSHVRGLGNLGFATLTLNDIPTGIRTESVYSQDWANHHQGLLTNSKTIAADGTALKDKQISWDVRLLANADGSPDRCFRFSPQTVTTNRDLNGAFMSRVTEATIYDDYGFPSNSQVTTSSEDGTRTYGQRTQTSYVHDTVSWRLGLATDVTATQTAPGQPDDVRQSAFTYDADGYVITQTNDPGTPLFRTQTRTRNGFGAITATTETWGETATDGIAATSRTSLYGYDAKMRYRTSETNPLGHVESAAYHAVLGIPISQTDANNLTTSFDYDAFGRLGITTHPDGTTTTVTRSFCGGAVSCAAGAVYKLHSITSGGAEQESDFNLLNKEVRMSQMVGGQMAHTDIAYDALAREISKTAPYFTGDAVYATISEYDVLGRTTRVLRPDGSEQTAVFNGLTQVSTNELGQTKTIAKDELDRQVAVTNTEGQAITYDYDAAGRLVTMTGDGKVTSYAYDLYGNKISDSDPDKGAWSYSYNALGHITSQMNAKGEVTRMTYDVLGRMLSRIDNADVAAAAERTSIWIYDTAANGIGKLHQSASGLAASGGLEGYTLTNSYDSLSRIVSSLETVDSEGFTTATSYDAFSRPATLTYPSSLTINNLYNAQGELTEVQDAAQSLWQRMGVDARGNITHVALGNGVESYKSFEPDTGRLTGIYSLNGLSVIQDLAYTKDYLGNLTQRRDKRQDLVEDFTYDGLNRVTQIATTQGTAAPTTVTLTYSVAGNILSKSDVGAYTYGEAHGACASGFAGPHAVTTITGVKNATYCYDLNGNMVSGDGRTVDYTAFDKPSMISKGGNSVAFFYGPDRKRYKRIDQTLTEGTATTVYVADRAYERRVSAAETTEKVYIGDFAVMTRVVPSSGGGGSVTIDYLHRDHLGSVDVITDASGNLAQAMSFDAFGKRRETNWTPLPESAITTFDTSLTTRGFTGHEQIDPVGLVHMNGRVYEPELGRFLSADPVVEDVENLQTYNRYSYVRNNPLTHTDPSGFYAVAGDTDAYGNVSASGDGGDTSANDSENNADVANNDDKSEDRTAKAQGDQRAAHGFGMSPAEVARSLEHHALGTRFSPTPATQAQTGKVGLNPSQIEQDDVEVAQMAPPAPLALPPGVPNPNLTPKQNEAIGRVIGRAIEESPLGIASSIISSLVSKMDEGENQDGESRAQDKDGTDEEVQEEDVEEAVTDPVLEPTPTTNPDKFGAIKGRKGKVNTKTGEVFEKDMLHKDHYEVYSNKKNYEKGARDRSVWSDGRMKQKF